MKIQVSYALSGKGDWAGGRSAVHALAKALGVTEAWLMGYDVFTIEKKAPTSSPPMPNRINRQVMMPVLGRVAAGLPIYAEENLEEYMSL